MVRTTIEPSKDPTDKHRPNQKQSIPSVSSSVDLFYGTLLTIKGCLSTLLRINFVPKTTTVNNNYKTRSVNRKDSETHKCPLRSKVIVYQRY